MKVLARNALRFLPAHILFYLETAYFLFRQRLVFDVKAKWSGFSLNLRDENSARLVKQVSEFGYVVVPGFKDDVWCASAREELLNAISERQRATATQEDERIFGIEKLSGTASEFANDASLLNMASAYAKSDERLLFCMANRVVYKGDEVYGSGGEWHRDGFRRELKAMIYLTDVSLSDGPFAIVPKSHRIPVIFRDVRKIGKWVRKKRLLGVTCTRLKDSGRRLDELEPGRISNFVMPAGTLILFDTSSIHVGQPPCINGKERLALTNYYCDVGMLEAASEYYRKLVIIN